MMNGQKSGSLFLCYLEENLCKSIKFLKNCRPDTRDRDGTITSWLVSDKALIAIPVADPDNEIEIKIQSYSSSSITGMQVRIPAKTPDNVIHSGNTPDGKSAVVFKIKKNDFVFCADLINSCGIEVNRSFYARDRGQIPLIAGSLKGRKKFSRQAGAVFL